MRIWSCMPTESSRTDSYTDRRPSVLLSFLVSSTLPMSTFFNLSFFFIFLLSCSSTHPFYIKDNAGQSNQSSGPSIAKVRVKNTIILVPEGEREFSWTCTQVHTSSKFRHTWAAMRHSNGLLRTSARLACEKLFLQEFDEHPLQIKPYRRLAFVPLNLILHSPILNGYNFQSGG